MALLPLAEMIKMYKILLAGGDVEAVTEDEKETKAQVLKDIDFAREHGFQIDFDEDE